MKSNRQIAVEPIAKHQQENKQEQENETIIIDENCFWSRDDISKRQQVGGVKGV